MDGQTPALPCLTPCEFEVLQMLARLHADALASHKLNGYIPNVVPTETIVASVSAHSATAVKRALTSLKKQGLVGGVKRWHGWRPTEQAQTLLAG